MIQFNLLPDVKLEYVKAQRAKNLVVSTSMIVAAVALGIFILLILTVDVWQKKTIHDYSGDIATASKKLQNTPNLNKILTIQSQLRSLDKLHGDKPVTSRLTDFIGQVTPSTATISDLKADYAAHTLTISGSASSLDVVNTFVDGLKFTKYTTTASSAKQNAFSNVVLSQFSRDTQHATYSITMSYDPAIFDGANDVTLSVPTQITTRSILEQPSSIFQGGQ